VDFANDRPNIFLLGFMGAGKTTIGKLLAAALGMHFVDLDDRIVSHHGCSINDIFSQHGEDVFRSFETQALDQVAQASNQVVSTGGGIVGRNENWPLMQRGGVTLFLECQWETIVQRLKESTDRPLVNQNSLQGLNALYQSRLPLYGQADYVVQVDGLTPPEIVEAIKQLVLKD
jgi:shikimate kinase